MIEKKIVALLFQPAGKQAMIKGQEQFEISLDHKKARYADKRRGSP